MFAGARRRSRGPWIAAEELPAHVREFLGIEKGKSKRFWTIPIKTVEELQARLREVCKLQRSNVLTVKGIADISPPDPQDIPRLKCMESHLDGAHCGLADWYPEIEKGIKEALQKGRNAVWTTGWYASKKEIASARITHIDGNILVEVSVSDDFDTEGRGETTIRHTTNLNKIETAIWDAWEKAEENQRDNRLYYGFSILKDGVWVETLIEPCGFGIELETPPGDNYHKWGFQGEGKVPGEVKEKLQEWVETWRAEENEENEFTYEGFTIKPWE